MCEALAELMAPEMEEAKRKATAEGRAEGRAEGLRLGIVENQRKTARLLFQSNSPFELIKQVCEDLSMKELLELQKIDQK